MSNPIVATLVVILLMVLVGALPVWPIAAPYGYWPSGGIGLVLIVVLVLILAGRI